MSFTQDDYKRFMANALKGRDDTFRFECKMCGKCCRRREKPIIINGADTFRMAKALGVPVEKAILEHTKAHLGDATHALVITLKERLDGSCSLLRKGHCMIQDAKPAVCALFPLGRMMDMRSGEIIYFNNQDSCIGGSTEKVWTLGEWLYMFHAEETEHMSAAWNKLFTGISALTAKMAVKNVTDEMQAVMAHVLYFNYDTSRDFYEQIEENKEIAKKTFWDEFHRKINYDLR